MFNVRATLDKDIMTNKNTSNQYVLISSVDGDKESIKGIMNSDITLSVSADWGVQSSSITSSVLGDQSIIGKGSDIAEYVGKSINQVGNITRVVYQGSTDLQMKVDIDVFDSNGDGLVPSFIELLYGFTLPQQEGKLNVPDKITNAVSNNDVLDKITTDNVEGSVGTVTGGILDDLNIIISKSPKPVNLKIGKWLEMNDMVITDINYDISKNYVSLNEEARKNIHGDKVPRNATFSISLTTRENIYIDQDGELKNIILKK